MSARKGRTPRRPPSGAGPRAARHSNSHVASGEPTHQLNGAYSRTDAPTPIQVTGHSASDAGLPTGADWSSARQCIQLLLREERHGECTAGG